MLDEPSRVREIQVKRQDAASHWIWGAFKMPGRVLESCAQLWLERDREDEYLRHAGQRLSGAGRRGHRRPGRRAYVDVGTLHGYRSAIALLSEAAQGRGAAGARVALGWPAGRASQGLHDAEQGVALTP